MRNVVCISEKDDQHTSAVCRHLNHLGIEVVVLDRARYCEAWNLTSWFDGRHAHVLLETKTKDILLNSQWSIYNRRDFTVTSQFVASEYQPEIKRYISEQRAIHVNSLLHELSDRCRMMNSPAANIKAQSKIHQLSIARKLGLNIPKTYIGGSAEVASHFQRDTQGNLIIKPLEGLHIHTTRGVLAHYTEEYVRKPEKELRSLEVCPVIIQEFIPKKYELRVTVVGDEVFACGIDTSIAAADAQVDWRHYDLPNTPHFAVKLPRAVEKLLKQMMSRLGIAYGAFDLICTPEDIYYFLEVNSMGQWLWIEDLTELPISNAIARWLSVSD